MSYTKQDQILWWMVSIWLIVDSITGFFISYSDNLPLSQCFKLLILTLIVIRLRYRDAIIVSLSLLTYLALYFLHLAFISSGFKEPIMALSKFLSLLYLYLYFRFSIRNFSEKAICNSERALITAWLVLAFNIILGIMGYGAPSYGEESMDMGVKGFFYAGNELGGIVAVLAPFMFYLIFVRFSGIKFFLVYIVVILIGILIGTKTAILATLLSAIVIPLLYLPPRKRIRLFIGIVLLIGFSIPFLVNMIAESSIGAVERWTYFYNNGGLTRLIFSGRDEFWEVKGDLFYKSDFLSRLFGLGGDCGIVERDHLDSLLMFGYLGFVFITSFFLYLLINAFLNRRNNSLMKIVIFSDLLIIGIGYMAGHVWFSAMASVYIALLNAFSSLHSDKILFAKQA